MDHEEQRPTSKAENESANPSSPITTEQSNTKKLIGKEKDVRVATERGGDAKRLSDKQAKVAKQTGDLLKKVKGQDAEKNTRAKDRSGKDQGKKNESQPTDPKQGEAAEGPSLRPAARLKGGRSARGTHEWAWWRT